MASERGRTFECRRCGARAIVAIEAHPSHTPWDDMTEPYDFSPELEGKARDAACILSLVRCPACARRSRAAIARSLGRATSFAIGVGVLAATFALAAFLPRWSLYLLPLGAIAGLLPGGLTEWRRWTAASEARVVRRL